MIEFSNLKMPASNKIFKGHLPVENINPTISVLYTKSTHLSGGNFSSNPTTDLLGNNVLQIKTEKPDESVYKSLPRMTIDGTSAPPRIFNTSLFYLSRLSSTLPYTSPTNVFKVRMSTGGRAPPKILSPQNNVPSLKQESLPCIAPSKFSRNITPERTSVTTSSPKESLRYDSTNTVVTVRKPEGPLKKRPRGRPKKIIHSKPKSRDSSFNNRQEESLSIRFECLKKRSRGRPRKNLANTSGDQMKKPRKRPRKNLGNTSGEQMKRPRGTPRKNLAITSEDHMKRLRGRPKGSVKKKKTVTTIQTRPT